MKFKKYPKIKRLGHEETDGILLGTCIIQEKIDGANTSIWLEDGIIQCGSRGGHLKNEGFNGFVPYAQGHTGMYQFFCDNPEYRLYGEWLVRHTISYNETAYKQFYLFDIEVDDKFLPQKDVQEIAEHYGIKYAQLFATLENPTVEQIEEFVGQTEHGEKGEGVVIKNHGYINGFGDAMYAKIVSEKFKENNTIVFGGNNKHSDCYWEMYVVNKFMTLARVKKVMNKLQPEIDRRLDKEHTARIIQTAYHDMITEEIWEIQKKVTAPLDFKKLTRIASRKAARIYHDILNDDISVAFKE